MKAIYTQYKKLMSRVKELWREQDSDTIRDAKLMEQAADTILYLKNDTKQHAYNQNKTETFEDHFYWSAAWYNGYEKEFDKVLNYLKEQQKTIEESESLWVFPISRPNFIVDSEDPIMELYWMQLVQDFGDYGTSPRFGWIDIDKLDDCINHITEMINKTYGEYQTIKDDIH